MIARNKDTNEIEELKGGRIKLGKLQRNADDMRDLTQSERKAIKGGVVISIIGVLIGMYAAGGPKREAAAALQKQQ